MIMNKLEYAAEIIEQLSKKDYAELRRPGFSPALWKVLTRLGESKSEYHSPYEWEKRWAILLRSIALTGQGQTPLGQALAKVGWSEGRLFRLLEAKGDAVYDQMRFATAYLESKDACPDWTQGYDMLFYNNERAHHAIARSYFTYESQSQDDTED